MFLATYRTQLCKDKRGFRVDVEVVLNDLSAKNFYGFQLKLIFKNNTGDEISIVC